MLKLTGFSSYLLTMKDLRDPIKTHTSNHPPGTPYTYQGPRFERKPELLNPTFLYKRSDKSNLNQLYYLITPLNMLKRYILTSLHSAQIKAMFGAYLGEVFGEYFEGLLVMICPTQICMKTYRFRIKSYKPVLNPLERPLLPPYNWPR